MTSTAYHPDQPIKSIEQDELGRKNAAQFLSGLIQDYSFSESLVIGVMGPWGSGKSSLINMALEQLDPDWEQESPQVQKQPQNDRPIIVTFNPWHYSDYTQLIQQFFVRLSAVLKRKDYKRQADDVVKRIDHYTKWFKAASYVPGLKDLVTPVEDVFKATSEATKQLGAMVETDLEGIKNSISKLLLQYRQKIVIVIDDVDRLNRTEIRQVFQLVKSLADFPYTIYLISFDHELVSQALEESQAGFSSDYLEKIIQIPIQVPAVPSNELGLLLANRLNEVLPGVEHSSSELDRLSGLYRNGLVPVVRHVRDINRLMNLLHFTRPYAVKELNLVDFVGLTALQALFPQIYARLPAHRALLLGDWIPHPDSRQFEDDVTSAKDQIQQLLALARSDREAEGVLGILSSLFPYVQRLFGRHSLNPNSRVQRVGPQEMSSWHLDGRVCSDHHFSRYFRMSLSPREISRSDIQALLSQAEDASALKSVLDQYKTQDKVEILLKELDRHLTANPALIPESAALPFLKGFLDAADQILDKLYGMFVEIEYSAFLNGVIYSALQRFETIELRSSAFVEAYKNLQTSIHRPLILIVGIYQEPDADGYVPAVTQETVPQIVNILRDKLNDWTQNRLDEFLSHPRAFQSLYAWGQIAPEDQQAFLARAEADPKLLFRLIECFSFEEHAVRGVSSARIIFDLNNFSSLIPRERLQELIPALESHVQQMASDESKMSYEALLSLVKQTVAGRRGGIG